MSDYEPTSRQETPSSDPESGKTSGTTAIGGLEGAASASPLPPRSSPNWPISASMSEQAPRPRARRSLSNMRRGLIVAAAADGFGDGIVRRSRSVVLGRSRPTRRRQQLLWTFWIIRRPGFQRTIWTGRGRVIGHDRERGQVELHPDHDSGSGGDR